MAGEIEHMMAKKFYLPRQINYPFLEGRTFIGYHVIFNYNCFRLGQGLPKGGFVVFLRVLNINMHQDSMG